MQIPPKIDYKGYFKEIKVSHAFCCLFLLSIFITFSIPVKEIYNTVFIRTFIRFCPKNEVIVDFVFLGYFGIAIYFLSKQLKKSLLISINSLIFSSSALIIYFHFFRSSPEYDFYFFKVKFLNSIGYSDSFVISSLIFLATYKSYFKALASPPSKFSLLEDGPSLNDYKDIYSREKYASVVADHISKTTTRNSFAIAIIGEWGSGKTDFLLRLKKSLQTNADNLVFDFI